MRSHLLLGVIISALFFEGPSFGQDAPTNPSDDSIDGSAPGTEPTTFEIRKTNEHQLADHRVIMHWVIKPGSANELTPPKTKDEDEVEELVESPEVQELIANSKERTLILLSATVVDHAATFFRWWHEGKEYRAWSNVDFNHFGSVVEVENGDQKYVLLMGTDNVSREGADPPSWQGELPDLGVGYPAYTLVDGGDSDDKAYSPFDALHDVYEADREEFIAAYEARQQAEPAPEELAADPSPDDTVIYFWPRRGSRYFQEEDLKADD